MAGFFENTKTDTAQPRQFAQSAQLLLMGINTVASAFQVYRMFQERANPGWFILDICTHLLTICLAQNRVPTAMQDVAASINLIQAQAILHSLSTESTTASFALGAVDTCLHLVNAGLIHNEDAANARYP